MNNKPNPICKRRASALVIVLWLVVLMTLVVTVTARMTLLEGRVSQLAVERIRGRWAARAGVETARALLLIDERDTDTLVDLWATNEEDLVEVPLEGCRFTVTVTDESGKLDINRVSDTQLAYLPDMQAEILDSILDWRDADDEVRPAGAETGYYLMLPYGYICRNGSLGSIRELLRVRGVEPDLFYGPQSAASAWSENEGWIHYLTCHSIQPNVDAEGNPRVNVNQADRNELASTLSLSRDQAQWIIDNRQFQTLVSLTEEKNTSTNTNTGGQNAEATTRSTTASTSTRGGNQQQQTGRPLEWRTVLQKADQIAFDGQLFTQGRVNINTADVIVLEALFGSRELAENIMAYRQGLDRGIQSLEELNRVQGMTEAALKGVVDQLALRSSVFLIQSTAVSDATGQSYSIEAILNRDDQDGRVLYWREQ